MIINMTIGHLCRFFTHDHEHYNLKVTSTAAAKMLNIFPRKGCIAEVIMMIMVVLVMRVVMIDGDHDGDNKEGNAEMKSGSISPERDIWLLYIHCVDDD